MNDTYSLNCICYLDEKRKKVFVLKLFKTSIMYFSKIYKIKKLKMLEDFVNSLNNHKRQPHPNIIRKMTEEALLDEIKLSILLESYMKAVLIDKGYLIHEIKTKNIEKKDIKDMAREQTKKPIKKDDYLKKDRYYYDEKKKCNMLKYLKETTITINTMLKNEEYLNTIGLPENIKEVAKQNKVSRNRLHYLVHHSASYNKKTLEKWETIKDFVENTIKKRYNELNTNLK